jgi:DNA repair protein RadC
MTPHAPSPSFDLSLPCPHHDVRVVAAVLGAGSPSEDDRVVATQLLGRVGGLRGLARAGRRRLVDHGSLSRPHAETLLAALSLAKRLDHQRTEATRRARFGSPEAIGAWAATRLGGLEHEELWALCLDVKLQLLAARRVFRGGSHTVPVHVPTLLREVVAQGSHSFALVHNHPSGDPTPSEEDVTITARIARAAMTLDVPLIDHVVVGGHRWACVPFELALDRSARRA